MTEKKGADLFPNIEKMDASHIGRGISFVFYSDPGVGKTTLAATLPVGETLIVNTEAGTGPLLATGHSIFNLLLAMGGRNAEDVVRELYVFLRTKTHPYKNIVIDNLSELEQILILSLTTRRGKESPELREYGDASFKMKEIVHNFRDLVHLGFNVVFNAWEFPMEIRNNDGVVITKTFPMVGKKIAPQICGIVDVVGHLEIHEKTGKRWVRFGPSEQYITKVQYKGLDGVGELADMPMIINKLKAWDYTKEQT
jgi:phage nucleotide-binding protein